MDEVRAVARYVCISPRKVQAVIGAIKGEPVEIALNKLKFMPQKAAVLLDKVVRSAVANAEENHEVDVDNLIVRNVYADQGPTMKRFKPRARGRATRILKRTAHITVILAEEQV